MKKVLKLKIAILSLVSLVSCLAIVDNSDTVKAAIDCSDPIVYNNTGRELDSIDLKQINESKLECKRRYKRSPCLYKIWISTDHSYKVICGAIK